MNQDAATGYYNIIGMTPDGATKKVLFAGTSEITEPKQGMIGSDGKTLLFIDYNEEDVYTYDMVTGDLRKIYDNASNGEGRTFEVAIFSPDMSLIYAYDRHNQDFCTIKNSVGGEIKVIYDGCLIYPSFAADGHTIVCDVDWKVSIGVVQYDGTGLQIIKEGYRDSDGDNEWSAYYRHPSAVKALNRIVYVKYESDTRTGKDWDGICIMKMDGSGEIKLAEVDYISPSASGDGGKIAFMKNNQQNDGAIVVGNFNGTALTNLTEIPVGEYIWRPYFNRVLPEVFASLPDFH